LNQSPSTISLISRIMYQLPTILLSAVTMVAISRNLGPSGRGEVSQFLLLSAVTSSVICTPVFLRVMNMKNSNEIKDYVYGSLYVFNRNVIFIITLMNLSFILFNQSKGLFSNLRTIILLDLLTFFYLISAQIRDLLLRFHKNKIYGIDFFIQLLISSLILLFLIFNGLSANFSLLIFTISYGAYAIILILVLKHKDHSFKASFVFRRAQLKVSQEDNFGKEDHFSKTGILFQFALSKDLLLGLVVLSKADFGLMSALASFWVVIRFLRPTAVIENKIGESVSRILPKTNIGPRLFNRYNISAIEVQMSLIGILGLSGYLLIPKLMGSGFQPALNMTIAGIIAEALLMKALYELSISKSNLNQNLFVLTVIVQVLMLGALLILGVEPSITLIWSTSAFSYLMWNAFSRWTKRSKKN